MQQHICRWSRSTIATLTFLVTSVYLHGCEKDSSEEPVTETDFGNDPGAPMRFSQTSRKGCVDDDDTVRAETRSSFADCASIVMACSDESALLKLGAPVGWVHIVCPVTCKSGCSNEYKDSDASHGQTTVPMIATTAATAGSPGQTETSLPPTTTSSVVDSTTAPGPTPAPGLTLAPVPAPPPALTPGSPTLAPTSSPTPELTWDPAVAPTASPTLAPTAAARTTARVSIALTLDNDSVFNASRFREEIASSAGLDAEDVVIESVTHTVEATYVFSSDVPLEVARQAIADVHGVPLESVRVFNDASARRLKSQTSTHLRVEIQADSAQAAQQLTAKAADATAVTSKLVERGVSTTTIVKSAPKQHVSVKTSMMSKSEELVNVPSTSELAHIGKRLGGTVIVMDVVNQHTASCHKVVLGRSTTSPNHPGECLLETATRYAGDPTGWHSKLDNEKNLGTSCCGDGQNEASREGCNKGQTHQEAFGHCTSLGMRLCTVAELAADKTAGRGCAFDRTLNWASDLCTCFQAPVPAPAPAPTQASCYKVVLGRSTTSPNHPGECLLETATKYAGDPTGWHSTLDNEKNLGTSCCGDAQNEASREGCNKGQTHQEAFGHCAGLGMRLCTVAELAADKTAGRGCAFDRTLNWASDLCMCFQAPIPAPTLAPTQAPSARGKQADAQFLLQATFGPTRDSLAELSKTTYEAWVGDQMAEPIELHRTYYRLRVNSRTDIKVEPGIPRSACSKGSRWNGFAFTLADVKKKISVRGNRILVESKFRSDIDPGLEAPSATCTESVPPNWVKQGRDCTFIHSRPWTCDWVWHTRCERSCYMVNRARHSKDCFTAWPNLVFQGYICGVEEAVGGWMSISTDSTCKTLSHAMKNPQIFLADRSQSMTSSQRFEEMKPGVILLAQSAPACNLADFQFIQVAGKHYKHDSRLELVDNTLDNPVSPEAKSCPNVPRTFLNRETCRLQTSCTPLGFKKALFQLNTSTLQQFLTVAQKYVYSISGLRQSSSPCGRLSRWERLDCSDVTCATTNLVSSDADAIANALHSETGWLRDISVTCTNVPVNAVVQLNTSEVFQHVHIHEHNVYDFSRWVYNHPGGMSFITKWAREGFACVYPQHHTMQRWDAASTHRNLDFIGRLGDVVDFQDLPSSLQIVELAEAFGSVGETGFFEACGSPGEVANDPIAGNQMSFYTVFNNGQDKFTDLNFDNPHYRPRHWWSKTTVWTMKALHGKDQLRQRVAWALSQIFVIGVEGFGLKEYNEFWLTYYDIFVRNAFGNFRNVLREVTYSAAMAEYLTFLKNSAYDTNSKYPDENYAREIMQLFTIGLWKLNPDGSPQLDENGAKIPTYDNTHIMSFARVFTGFDRQLSRANYEFIRGRRNMIDPMRMKEGWHDVYPKPDLDGNYLGDGYPLCSDLPVRAFLTKGATFSFIGYTHDKDDVLVLSQGSQLYEALCGNTPAGQTRTCNFELSVQLSGTLPCHGEECGIDVLQTVKVAQGYYKYVRPTCVHLHFFNGQQTAEGGRRFGWRRKCADPNVSAAGVSCCGGCDNRRPNWFKNHNKNCANAPDGWIKCTTNDWWKTNKFCAKRCSQKGLGYDGDDCSFDYREQRSCRHPKQLVRFKFAEDQCASLGLQVCALRTASANCSYDNTMVWMPMNCSLEIAVDDSGKVSVQTDAKTKQNKISVQWQNGFPTVDACPTSCRASGGACICAVNVDYRAVFDRVPSKSELQTKLRIGAFPPEGPCTSCSGDVIAYAASGKIDERTVFESEGRFFSNTESFVHVGSYSFRNPPVFMLKDFRSEEAALAEVESLLDHLFHHPNTPVFIGYRLIQRFVTSNPSPAYIRAVAEAFKAGKYGNVTYSGQYGDLAATIAAVLLHPEARNPQSLETHGVLREPIIKLIHFLRAMEYVDVGQRETVLDDVENVIAQAPFQSPTVFNFYNPDYQPARFAEGVFAPEFQIFTPPMSIGFLNGMMALIKNGLSNCEDGFGPQAVGCQQGSFAVSKSSTINDTLSELDLLLTGGRLTSNKDLVRTVYEKVAAGQDDPVKAAQQVIVMTPAFHTLGDTLPAGRRAVVPPTPAPAPKSYKAMVHLFLNGGADTFNMLVPMKCSLYDEYMQVRTDISLQPFQLHEISTVGQPCKKFGIHFKLPFVRELYDRKRAAFVGNIGSLVEPTTKEQFKRGGRMCVGLFSHSDQRQAAQTLKCQIPGSSPKGTGGRIADMLAAKGLKTTSFSIAGTATWSQGFQTNTEIIDRTRGAVRLKLYQQLETAIGNITSQRHNHVYSEEYVQQFAEAIESSESLGNLLEGVTLKTTYDAKTGLAKQLKQVARLIATREARKAERDFFHVELGGFDTHNEVIETLVAKFTEVDDALRTFVAELEAQDVFKDTVLVTGSDFGRTLTTNGRGTDHAWAGNHIVLGGSINGGRIFNDFPASLLEGNDQDAGRGRLIPKYPWESVMVPISEWMGVTQTQKASVFPNLANFNLSTHIIRRASLFES